MVEGVETRSGVKEMTVWRLSDRESEKEWVASQSVKSRLSVVSSADLAGPSAVPGQTSGPGHGAWSGPGTASQCSQTQWTLQ